MSRVEIRPATDRDVEACAALAAAEDDRSAESHRERLAGYLAEPDRVRFLVAAAGGEIVGSARVAWFEPDVRDEPPAPTAPPAPTEPTAPPAPEEPPAPTEPTAPAGWYLVGLVVAPDRRGEGIGLALTAERLRWTFERADEAWYFTAARNTASQRLHARFGFTEVTRDFAFPRVNFAYGDGILFRVTAATATL